MRTSSPSSSVVARLLSCAVASACARLDDGTAPPATATYAHLAPDRWEPTAGAAACAGEPDDEPGYEDEVDRRLLPHAGEGADLRITVRPSFDPEAMVALHGDTVRAARFARSLWAVAHESRLAAATVDTVIDGDTMPLWQPVTRADMARASVAVAATRVVLARADAAALRALVGRAIARPTREIAPDGTMLRLRDADGACVAVSWTGPAVSPVADVERVTLALLDTLLGPPPRPEPPY